MPRLHNAPQTRERLLDAAEQLFAEHGAAATSLRAVTNGAGANPAAVHYHFGSKEDLLLAVAQRRADPLNAERLERLARLEASADGEALPLAPIVEAFLAPEILNTAPSPSAILHREPREDVARIVPRLFGEVHLRFSQALARALPELSPALLDARLHFVVGLMLHAVRGFTEMPTLSARHRTASSHDREALLAQLVCFSVAGLAAPGRESTP